jgi:hypothetical protein
LIISDPHLAELEKNGYVRGDLTNFTTMSLGGATSFGGFDDGSSSQLVQDQFAYLQYVSRTTGNCHLIFVKLRADYNEIIADIDVSQLNKRIHAFVTPMGDDFVPFLNCAPMGWSDVNHNGRPDMPVTLLWGNHYTGSELHIFEISDDATVVDLTKDLPGIMSPWDFDPTRTDQVVMDLAWADHDCIYPPIHVFWIYDWRDGPYVDVTPEFDFSDYIASLKSDITQSFGNPFNHYFNIGPLTELLLIYERIGQRDQGWREYKELTNLSHWPDTDPEDMRWLNFQISTTSHKSIGRARHLHQTDIAASRDTSTSKLGGQAA